MTPNKKFRSAALHRHHPQREEPMRNPALCQLFVTPHLLTLDKIDGHVKKVAVWSE